MLKNGFIFTFVLFLLPIVVFWAEYFVRLSFSFIFFLFFIRVENLYILLIVLVNKQLKVSRINKLKNKHSKLN
jgi:hypothetical protein